MVQDKEILAFELLKRKIAEKMQQSYPGINSSVSEWKGQEIADFQEELSKEVNTLISEKWFYNHFKSTSEKLPRIDMLNLLSKYCGYSNWDDFRYRNSGDAIQKKAVKSANLVFLSIPLLVFGTLFVFFILFRFLNSGDYKFQFVDADTKQPILNSIIEISVLRDGESPVCYLCGQDGSFLLKTAKSHVRFVVKSPYYQLDTIVRILDKFNRNEIVRLKPDNYAMMLQYFSTMNLKDWQKRREQLNRMIADSALIYQVFDTESVGVELYNKPEFINKITMPSTGLKNIEILDTKYRNDQILLIRFRQKGGLK